MTVLEIIKVVIALATIATGLVSLLFPRAVFGFTGLHAPGGRGVTEIRAILGGLFIGVGLAPFLLPQAGVYPTLGIMYLAIAAARLVGIVVDKSSESSNWISLAVEIVFGVLLVL